MPYWINQSRIEDQLGRILTRQGQPRKAARADEARKDRSGLLRLIARGGPGLSNFCRLLIGRNALPENPLHITLDGDASPSETSNAR